jgi:hypothetical protein
MFRHAPHQHSDERDSSTITITITITTTIIITTNTTAIIITLLAPSLLCPSLSFAFIPLSLKMQPPKSKCTQFTVISFANSMFSTLALKRDV